MRATQSNIKKNQTTDSLEVIDADHAIKMMDIRIVDHAKMISNIDANATNIRPYILRAEKK